VVNSGSCGGAGQQPVIQRLGLEIDLEFQDRAAVRTNPLDEGFS
jgi:hypothetical protein